MYQLIDAQAVGRRIRVTLAQRPGTPPASLVVRATAPEEKAVFEAPLAYGAAPEAKGRTTGLRSLHALLPIEFLRQAEGPVQVDVIAPENGMALTSVTVAPDVFQAPIGFVDLADGGGVYGWAWDPARPCERVNIRVLRRGSEVARIVANRFRSDLLEVGLGDGCHAYELSERRFLQAPDELEFSLDGGRVIVNGMAAHQRQSHLEVRSDLERGFPIQLSVTLPRTTDRVTLR